MSAIKIQKKKEVKWFYVLVIAPQYVPIFRNKQHFPFSTFSHSTMIFFTEDKQGGFCV